MMVHYGGAGNDVGDAAVPRTSTTRHKVAWLATARWCAALVLCAIALTSAVAAIGYAKFGSLTAAGSYICGERLILSPACVRVNVTPGERRTIDFRISNFHDSPIQVVGGTSTCSCIALEDVPLRINGSAAERMRVSIAVPRDFAAMAEQVVTFYTDAPDCPKMVARVLMYCK